MSGSRGVVTLLFTDLVSSTEMLGRLGDAGAEELRRTHFALLRGAVAGTGGQEVKSLGDGLMVAFESPLDALECAIAMQRAIAEHNRAAPALALGVRVGLHAGEPARDEDDFFGTAVVVAKRLCDRAEGGQILASEVVTGLVGSGHGVTLLPVGRLRLKGLTEPTAAVLVAWDRAAPSALPPAAAGVGSDRESADPAPAPDRPPLVGRTPELERLQSALAGAATGRGRMGLVVGEMGVGKTRLAEEVLGLGRRQGFTVLVGRTGQANSGLAYAPFLSAFGPFLRRLPPVRRDVLLDGLPHLARLWPDLGLTPPAPLADPELDRTLLFEAVARLIERLTTDTGLVILLDDLHWADGGTLALLSYLTHGLAEASILVLVTYRPEGLGQSRALRHLVTDAMRSGLAIEIALTGLGDADVASMAAGLLGGDDAPQELVAMLHDRTAGTPLFVDALVRGLQDADALVQSDGRWVLADEDRTQAVPRGVRDLVVDRLEALTAAERSVVDLVAHDALGLPHDLLEEAAGADPDELLDAVGRLVKAGLLLQDSDGADVVYRLFHPLIQEVAAAELPAVAGRRVHARLAQAVEQRQPSDLDRLAFHYSRAGRDVDPGRALQVLLDAGERALGLAAHDQAARHYGAALAFIRDGHRPELLGPVLERLGESWAAVGEMSAAAEVWSEAATEQRRNGDLRSAARICRRSALAARDCGDVESARRHLDEGVALLADEPASAELVDLHHARLLVDSPLFEPERAARTVDALVAAAATLSSAAAAVASLSAEGQLALGRGNYQLARSKSEAALRIAEESDDYPLLQRARRDLAWIVWADADVPSCTEQVEAHLELDRRFGVRSQEPLGRIQFAIFDQFRGTWDRVEAQAEEALAQARRYGQARVQTIAHGTLAWFLTDRGDLERAEAHLAEARRTIDVNGRDRALHWIRVPEALLALERGDAAAAQKAAAQLPLPKGRAIMADAHLLAGEPEAARTIGQGLATGGPPGSYSAALSDRILGLVARAEDGEGAGTDALTRSAEALETLGLPFEAAISRFHLGTVDDLRAALTAFEALGAERWADRARRSLRSLGIRVASPRRRQSPAGQPLSPRELEVARLAVEGLANAEIAERLVLSVRTVESHLDHIYARLGLSGRLALTRWMAANDAATP